MNQKMVLTKQALSKEIAAQFGLSVAKSARVTSYIFNRYADLIVADGRASIPNIGTITTVNRQARTIVTPHNGERMNVPARKSVKLRPGRDIKRRVNGQE